MAIAILPAAGRSSRMGRPKLLLPLSDEPGDTIIGRLVSALREGGVDRLVVVTAAEGEDLREWAAGERLATAVNPTPERGMLSTILCGLDHFEAEDADLSGPLLVSPADVPGVSPVVVRELIAAVQTGAELAQPTFRGKSGHPLAISANLLPELRRLDPEVGLKQIRQRYSVREIETGDEGVVRDVDTPEDYARLRGESAPDG